MTRPTGRTIVMVMNKGERTKTTVLDRAIQLSSTVGLEGLSLGNLARDVGMSKSGLFAHFASKEQLQIDVIHRAVERFVRTVIAPALREPRGEPRVRALFENWLRWDASPDMPGGCVFMSYSHELDDRPGPVRDALVAQLRDWVEALSTAARITIDEGHFRSDLDIDAFVYEQYGVVLAYNLYKRLLGEADAEARARAAFDSVIQRAKS